MIVNVNTARVRARMRTLTNGVENVASEMISTLAEVQQTNAKSSKLFKTHSPNGGLRANIIIEKMERFTSTVKANKFYAVYVEKGNGKPGDYIYPVRAKALRFVINGELVFRKRVKTSAPRPFMGTAFELTKRFAPSYLNSRLSRFVKDGT